MALFQRKAKRDYTIEEQLARGPMDLPFLTLVLILTAVGLIALLSSSFAYGMYNPYPNIQDTGGDPYYFLKSQAKYAIGGVIAMFLISKFNYERLRGLSLPAIIGSIVLLLLIFTPLGRSSNGARRWLSLFGIRFQPSELVKAAVVMYFSAKLSQRANREVKPLRKFPHGFRGIIMLIADRSGFVELLPYGIILLVIVILLRFQPHMSGIILVGIAGASVLFASGISLAWFVLLGGAAGAGLWYVVTQTDYMKERVDLWLEPWDHLQEGGYQLYQSQIAVGSGGLLGTGLGNSTQKFLYLPEMQNDFIYAIWCEEMGFIGAVLLIVLFTLLIIRGFWLALHARDRFGTLLIVGFTSLIAAQAGLNMAVVTGTIPTTGISLPFFSYGGTALLVNLAEMGVILSVSRQITAPKTE